MLDYAARAWERGAELQNDTDPGIRKFLTLAIRDKTKVDNLVIFSDMVIGDGKCWGFSKTTEQLLKDFKKLNPECKVVCVNLRSTGGKSIFHYQTGVLEIAGWSEHIFDTIKQNARGYQEIIKEIEAIDL